MEKVKTFLANTIVKKFKSLGFCGALRFKMLYWAYRITGWHIRADVWDWVLEYLPKLDKWQQFKVLDIGTTSSLFIYELKKRGYRTYGLDIRPYQEKLKRIAFILKDITIKHKFVENFDFITCISVLEHTKYPYKAVETMALNLKRGGRLLLTIPTKEYAQGHEWEGFSYEDFLKEIVSSNFHIAEYTERKGQICACLVKK